MAQQTVTRTLAQIEKTLQNENVYARRADIWRYSSWDTEANPE
eukprot:CAMPEP_0118660702 /NCGR_PEP_ID=MMETSP0785-20121206/15840_1 /TAXON_ID=91992 /ORGANISM="Bolidomonas pacifica, Strain CCMP 1866" /LENGTH=42 /DNA_ID= /DNA_START= /DNA_END= /DNA_ORIENTATION=